MKETTKTTTKTTKKTTTTEKRKAVPTKPSHATQKIISEVLAIMAEQEMTSRELCWEAGIDEGQFSKWSNCKANFSIDRVQSILDCLGYEMVIVPKAEKANP